MNDIVKTIKQNKFLFTKYNEDRKAKASEVLIEKQRAVFSVIPLLIHLNYSPLPGITETGLTGDLEAPFGISCFKWNKETVDSFNFLFPKNKITKDNDLNSFIKDHDLIHEKINPKERFIESVLLMGSIGTVAQTSSSDFDYWVCIDRKRFSTDKLSCLEGKLRAIEEWTETKYNMDVNFFVVDVDHVRADDFGAADKESAGSSQGKILKEEFYRTMILKAGKIPLWWGMPVDISDELYKDYKNELKKKNPALYNEFLDLGNIYEISDEEFFGAALWQINKAMNSPFKSVLKMALLEIFIDKSEKRNLLSNVIKSRVFNFEKDLKLIDPYVAMCDSIIKYNQNHDRLDSALLIQKCFYIKSGVHIKLSKTEEDSINFKKIIMGKYIKEWGWDESLIKDLNNFKDWDFNAVATLGSQVHKFLIDTYVRLSNKLKMIEDLKQKISKKDTTVLGRKLSIIYKNDKRPEKVEYLKRAFDKGLEQEDLTLNVVLSPKKSFVWCLYRGKRSGKDIQSPTANKYLIRASRDLVDIIVWMLYNKIYTSKSYLYLIPNQTNAQLTVIEKVILEIRQFFPPIDISSIDNEALLNNSKKTKFYIIINFTSDFMVKAVETLHIVYSTSWGELCLEHFKGEKSIDKVITYMIENSPKGVSDFSKYYKIYILKTKNSKSILTKVNNKIKENLRRESYRY